VGHDAGTHIQGIECKQYYMKWKSSQKRADGQVVKHQALPRELQVLRFMTHTNIYIHTHTHARKGAV